MIIDLNNDSDVELLRRATDGRRVGLTSGSYDLFHHLHMVYLVRCRRLCDILLVGVDSDDLIKKRKGPNRPLIPEHQRVAVVSGLTSVHAAFVLGSVEDFGRAVDLLGVKVIFKNQDIPPDEILGRDRAEVIIVPDMIQHSSTSAIIEDILRRRTPEDTGPRTS